MCEEEGQNTEREEFWFTVILAVPLPPYIPTKETTHPQKPNTKEEF